MATANAEDGYRTRCQSSDPPDRMNGDADLDYTITMNDWEDDASNDSSANNIVMEENNKTALPSSVLGNVGASKLVGKGEEQRQWREIDQSLNSSETIKDIEKKNEDKENNVKTVHEDSNEMDGEAVEKEHENGKESETAEKHPEYGKESKEETVEKGHSFGKEMETVEKEHKDDTEREEEIKEKEHKDDTEREEEIKEKEHEDAKEREEEIKEKEHEDAKEREEEIKEKEHEDAKEREEEIREKEHEGAKEREEEGIKEKEHEGAKEREDETAEKKHDNVMKTNVNIHHEERIFSEDLKNVRRSERKDEFDVSPEKDGKAKSGENEIDDDIIEIDDSGLMRPLDKKTNESRSLNVKESLNTSSVDMPSYTGAAANILPYLSIAGASILPTGSGIHLVLPQGTAGIQGSNMMYLPNNGALVGATSSASLFSPQATVGNNIQSRNSNSLNQQYPNMTGQTNRFLFSNRLLSSYHQTQRPPGPVSPALNNVPDKPTSSTGMIEMIRWEVENHINIKPKYAKPNPKAELGHLAKWTFDLGSDLVKGYVYRDLVRIQHRRRGEGSLSDKEKEDFIKLQEIDKELNQKVGHLKVKLVKSCKCGFKTELAGVLHDHQQHAHTERGGVLNCVLCKFSTRQPSAFRFHMEAEHNRVGIIENRPGFYACSLCPYETNYTNRLEQHKVRCQRQYREAFNLHPSSITGPEVSLCLENVFYFVFTRQFMNTIIPKPPPRVSSSTKIRDIPSKVGAPVNSLLAKRVAVNMATKSLVPKVPVQYPQRPKMGTRQQSQPNANMSYNFPVISPKVSTVPNVESKVISVANQPSAPTYTSGRSQLPVSNQVPVPGPNQVNTGNGFEVCEICGGYVKDRKALRIHFFYAHRIDMPFGVFERPLPTLYCATCFARFWTAQGLQKHIEVHKNDMMGASQSNNGVAGKCISCGHRVPNILMHMRMVHNRELRHYLAALMCIFCGNRFTAKTDVETHMSKVHGVIVKNTNGQGSMASERMKQTKSNPVYQANAGASKQQGNSVVSKGSGQVKMKSKSQCVLCNCSFARNVELTRHCMRVHHTCMKCGLVVVDKESLARHTCLLSASGMRTCQICKESGFHPAYYIKHMRDKHLRKCSVVLRHIDRAVVETMKQPITISDSEDDEPVSQPTEAKRPKTDFMPEAGKGKICEKTRVVDNLQEEDIEKEKQEINKEESKDTISVCDDKNVKCQKMSDSEELKKENCLKNELSVNMTDTGLDNEADVSDVRDCGIEDQKSHNKEDGYSDGKKDLACENNDHPLSIRNTRDKGESLERKRKLEKCDNDQESSESKKMLLDCVDGPSIVGQD